MLGSSTYLSSIEECGRPLPAPGSSSGFGFLRTAPASGGSVGFFFAVAGLGVWRDLPHRNRAGEDEGVLGCAVLGSADVWEEGTTAPRAGGLRPGSHPVLCRMVGFLTSEDPSVG